MKTTIISIALVISSFTQQGFSQEKSARLERAQKMAEKEKLTESLVASGRFMFIATFALPTGYPQVNLSSNPNYLKFQPDMIESQMPFFGSAYSTSGYGTDTGMKFKGKPEGYSLTKGRKNWQIRASVSDNSDRFRILLEVTPSGSANLSITSNRRSTISYSGEIFPIGK
jgi:hypothetical protein